jgi:hypothetical protein
MEDTDGRAWIPMGRHTLPMTSSGQTGVTVALQGGEGGIRTDRG